MNFWQMVTLGVSHKTAAVSLRERLAFRSRDIPRALGLLVNGGPCHEAVILSTCNRVELYVVGHAEGSFCPIFTA